MANEVDRTLHGCCRARHFDVQWGNNAYVAVRHLVNVVRRAAVVEVCVAAAATAILQPRYTSIAALRVLQVKSGNFKPPSCLQIQWPQNGLFYDLFRLL